MPLPAVRLFFLFTFTREHVFDRVGDARGVVVDDVLEAVGGDERHRVFVSHCSMEKEQKKRTEMKKKRQKNDTEQ